MRRGRARALRYCEERGIAHERCGKLIVATDASELPRLDELERRGNANGVPGLRRLEAGQIEAVEPHARGSRRCTRRTPASSTSRRSHAPSPTTSSRWAEAWRGAARSTRASGRAALRLVHARGATEARHAIFCAGAWADRLAVAAGAGRDPRIVPFRGAYLRLAAARRHLVRSLIYPVPDPSLPFLGVHLTRHVDGEVLIGPTALIAGARDAYAPWRLGAPGPARHARLAGHVADARALVAHRAQRAAAHAAAGEASGRGGALRPRAAGADVQTRLRRRARPGARPRRAAARRLRLLGHRARAARAQRALAGRDRLAGDRASRRRRAERAFGPVGR